jgi:hypothetical protein
LRPKRHRLEDDGIKQKANHKRLRAGSFQKRTDPCANRGRDQWHQDMQIPAGSVSVTIYGNAYQHMVEKACAEKNEQPNRQPSEISHALVFELKRVGSKNQNGQH